MIEFQKEKFSSYRFNHGWSICLNSSNQRKKISDSNDSDHYTLYCSPNAWRIEILFFTRFVSRQNNYGSASPRKAKTESFKVKPPHDVHRSLHKMKNVFFGPKHSTFWRAFEYISKKLSWRAREWKKYYMVTFNLSRSLYTHNIITLTGMCYHHGFLFVCGRMIEYFRKEICTFLMVFHRHDWHQVKYVKS